MKIKSRTNIITNSSDECWLIKTDLSPEEAKEKFWKYMDENHSEEWNEDWRNYFSSPRTYEPDSVFRSSTDEGVVFDWGSMCNLLNAWGYLKECFGVDPIESGESKVWEDIDISWLEEMIYENKKQD